MEQEVLFWISPLDCEILFEGGLGQDAGWPVRPFAICRPLTHSRLHSDPFECSLTWMVLLAPFTDGKTEVLMGKVTPHRPHGE